MGKVRREDKRARREEQKRAEQEAADLQKKVHARRRFLVAFVPALTAVIAVVSYVVLHSKQLAGVAVLVGVLVWLPVSIGYLGSRVSPKDRKNAGSIDFGHRG